jgi:hypothetical protein
MIQEVIVTTENSEGQTHIAPMGIHLNDEEIIILPFRPSRTLNNLLTTGKAIINYCDDVRIFAGCLTGRYEWPLTASPRGHGRFIQTALAYREIILDRMEDNDTRPKLFCKTVYEVNQYPFKGFNRAQFAVLEAAILVSRLNMLSMQKIESEIAYLEIGLHKTASPNELEAWGWLMDVIEQHKHAN